MTKSEFQERLNLLITPYTDSYKGKEPIISWEHHKLKPTFQKEFWNHLPLNVQNTIEVMMDQIE